MNDFEQKLARQNFRQPPAELRAKILRVCESAALATVPAGSWREWLWPSPRAWAALAALWALFAADQFLVTEPSPRRPALQAVVPDHSGPGPLLTFHNSHDLLRTLELPN